MHGMVGRDGGFAEYMITSDIAIMKIPDDLPFERKNVHILLLPLFGRY
jgi:propanol-preferring alcohol dehydrogenase